MTEEWQRGEYAISTDPARLDIEAVHAYLNGESYWAASRSLETVRRSMENSLCFGLYKGPSQAGFARAVTDYATFAWIADVFVLPEHRGQGLAKWLMSTIVAHPKLQGLRRMVLATRDAHSLYAQSGFGPLSEPERWMERSN
jgi:GNAT superfamily N-acetyltransferase